MMNNQLDRRLVESMPKAELHAHLNGSLTDVTLRKLDQLKNNTVLSDNFDSAKLINGETAKRTLDECFQVFKKIHQLTDTPEAIYLACCDVIREFSDDNVRYLELRTTPRPLSGSMELYVDTVVKAIDDCRHKIPILVKLLVSIDRSRGIETAHEIVNLAVNYASRRSDVVVGLDVSGNMIGSDIVDYFPLLEKARKAGLKLSIHTAEVHNDRETEAILRFHPDRIGHGTFIPPLRCSNPLLLDLLKGARIPLELCLTSNVLCNTVTSYEDHHLRVMLEHGIPFSLCTDDKGVFGTTLSQEYLIAGHTFSLSIQDLWKISYDSLDYAFMTAGERDELKSHWNLWMDQSGLKNMCIDKTK